MIHITQQRNFRTMQWPFGVGHLSRVLGKTKGLNVARISDLLLQRVSQLAQLTTFYSEFSLVNVCSPRYSRYSWGFFPPPPEDAWPLNAKLLFTFQRQRDIRHSYLLPKKVHLFNNEVRYWSGSDNTPRFVTVALTPLDCQKLGITSVAMTELEVLYALVGLYTKNAVMTESKGHTELHSLYDRSVISVLGSPRVPSRYWGACRAMYATDLLDDYHLDVDYASCRAAINAMRELGNLNNRYLPHVADKLRDYVAMNGGDLQSLRNSAYGELFEQFYRPRADRITKKLGYVHDDPIRLPPRALHMLMDDTEKFITAQPLFMAEFERACQEIADVYDT